MCVVGRLIVLCPFRRVVYAVKFFPVQVCGVKSFWTRCSMFISSCLSSLMCVIVSRVALKPRL